MSQAFLEQVANKIKNNFPEKGNRLCVVMPNRRAGLFLKRYLAPADQKPVWAPAVFSVEDFFAHVSGLAIPDTLGLMLGLYEAHLKVEQTSAQSFDEFTSWGRGLLRDFDETDHYLVNPESMFHFLSETKALSLWNMDERPLTSFEQQYLQFFNSLPAYYQVFSENLLNQQQAYHGLACRKVAEQPDKYLKNTPWDHFIFAGFNAITPAQLHLIRHLISNGTAEVIWDADAHYINDPIQEAGRFLRQYKNDRSLGEFGEISDFFSHGKKEINIAGVPRNTGQARLAGTLVKALMNGGDPDILSKTAVVLADESLLLPLLNAIPAEAGQFNITMGYPLQFAPLYKFFERLMMMHANASAGKNKTEAYFYYKDIRAVLQHAYFPFIIDPKALQIAVANLQTARNPFLCISDLISQTNNEVIIPESLKIIFEKITSPANLTHLIIRVIDMFRSAMTGKNEENAWQNTDIEILYNLAVIANRLHTLTSESGIITSFSTLHSLFREMASSTPVAFYGEPLKGIQVMGMLETRTLDFENVILLSVNEDTLPAKKSFNSFIPFDVRQHFGMPTHQDQQAVYAYHFYRLLQRSKKTWLIYNSESDELGGGEKSRFISQITYELPRINPEIRIQEYKLSQGASLNESSAISISKDETILQKLGELSKKGLSPTALNKYLNCTLRFYFTYILKLSEPEEAEETMDYRTLGNIVHDVMYEFFLPFTGMVPDRASLTSLIQKIPGAIEKSVDKYFNGGEITLGRNLLIIKVAEVWIRRLIETEISETETRAEKLTIIALEETLEKEMLLQDAQSEERVIKLKGTADRIDRTGNQIRIIDYKTGKVEQRDIKIKHPGDLFDQEKPLKEKAFQLLFYMLLARDNDKIKQTQPGLKAGIISFRSLNQGFIPLLIEGTDIETALHDFEENLKEMLLELFNTEIPFKQTLKTENCSICPFKPICHKGEENKAW